MIAEGRGEFAGPFFAPARSIPFFITLYVGMHLSIVPWKGNAGEPDSPANFSSR